MRIEHMRRPWVIGGIIVSLLVFAGGTTAYIATAQDPLTIVRTSDGFEPETIHIDVGDTVTFVNDSSDYMWPAANSHPTHSTLLAFDPQDPIAAGDSWSFTFESAGRWGFHDHLEPGLKGMIVAGSEEAIAATCDQGEKDVNQLMYCWGNKAKQITRAQGFDAVFDWFAEMHATDPVFRNNCHDVTHVVGEVAYEAFENDHKTITRPETSYCGYGFYHGFIEVALASYGQEYEQRAREYCDVIGESQSFETSHAATAARDACDHGIGHAIFDSLNSSTWGDPPRMIRIGHDICSRIYHDDEKRQISCGSGISNALAKAFTWERYYLSMPEEDPTPLCKPLERKYQRFCFMELGLHFARATYDDLEDIISYFMSFNDKEMTAGTIEAIVDDEIRYTSLDDDIPGIHRICDSLADETYTKNCITGAMIGLRGGGTPGSEHRDMMQLCSLFEQGSAAEDHCWIDMFSKLMSVYDHEKFKSICPEIGRIDENRDDLCMSFADRIK